MKFRSNNLTRKLRAGISCLLVIGLCASLIPLSIPGVNAPVQKSGEAFPCQNRPCGCQTAAQCWKSCCCFTDTQKVAWAASHRVQLPEFVKTAAAAENQHSQHKQVEIAKSASACCGDSITSTQLLLVARESLECCSKTSSEPKTKAPAACCQTGSADPVADVKAKSDSDAAKSPTSSIVLLLAQKCQTGQSTVGCSIPWCVVPEIAASVPEFRPSGRQPISHVHHCDRLADSIEPPPPRLTGLVTIAAV